MVVKTFPLSYNNTTICTVVINNKLIMRGEDVAKILEYEDPIQTIEALDAEDRFSLKYNSEGTENISIFINELSVYSLIILSKSKEKNIFKKWFTWYKEGMERRINEQFEAKLREKDEEIEKTKRHSLRLKDKLIESHKKKKDEIVYISSSDNYAIQNRYKIGGVGKEEHLVTRLAAYNSRSAAGDEWKYCLTVKVSNFRQFESRFWDLLSDFKDKKNKEIIIMYYPDLEEIFKFIAENYNKDIDFLNSHVKQCIENINYNKLSFVPEPMEIDVPDKRKVKKSYVTLPDRDELYSEVKKFMMSRVESPDKPCFEFLRSEVNDHCIRMFKKFSKREVWKIMKELRDENKKIRLQY